MDRPSPSKSPRPSGMSAREIRGEARGHDSQPAGAVGLESWLLSNDWVQMLPNGSRERVIADSFEKVYGPKEFVARKGEAAAYWIGVVDGLLKVSTVTMSGRSLMFTAVPSGSWV